MSPSLSHDHEPGRERDQLLHYAPLVSPWLTQNGVKGCDNRHPQFAQQCQNVTAGGPAENAELVLQADDVHVADVEEVRGPQIGRQVLLLNLETNYFRVLVATFNVIDRHRETLALVMRSRDGREQIRRECGYAAHARKVVANKSNLVHLRMFFHVFLSFRAARATIHAKRARPREAVTPAWLKEDPPCPSTGRVKIGKRVVIRRKEAIRRP